MTFNKNTKLIYDVPTKEISEDFCNCVEGCSNLCWNVGYSSYYKRVKMQFAFYKNLTCSSCNESRKQQNIIFELI